MRVLPYKEFRRLAESEGFSTPEALVGFIDKETSESIVPEGTTTRIKLHELGHEKFKHLSKSRSFYGKMEPWAHHVDNEIEADIFSFKEMGKKLTLRVGLGALRELLLEGWNPDRALSFVIGRLRNFGIETDQESRESMARIVHKGSGVEFNFESVK